MDKQNVAYPYNGGIHSAIIGGIYSAIKQNELSTHTHTHTLHFEGIQIIWALVNEDS